jgi:23S rRNA pseudouridine1911/1915/1917 synthase
MSRCYLPDLDESLVKEATVSSQHHGMRVDVVLAQLFPDFSRSQLTTWLKAGAATIDGRCFKPKDKVHGGEHVKLHVTQTANESRSEPENIPLNIVFEDEYLLVVNKPAGLVVHPGAGNPQHTLVNALLYHAPTLHHLSRAGIVHRLDKDTTGLLIVAKTLATHTSLIRQMQAKEIQRQYLALVYGHVIAGETIDTYYGRHPRNRLKMAVCAQGRQAITQFTVRKKYQHFSLLDVTLMTGRTHQIRVHMAHINHPVVGDPLYGGRTRIPAGISDTVRQVLQSFKRQALHACSLTFNHPHTHEKLNFTAPLPEDFQLILTTLDTNCD